jgi:hypothetical protein
MQAWAGQSVAMGRDPAGDVVREMWNVADELLRWRWSGHGVVRLRPWRPVFSRTF